MTEMNIPAIWKKLLVDRRRIVTSREIRELAAMAGKKSDRSLRYLLEHGYIVRILRGIFYVRSADERERGYTERSTYGLVADALRKKRVRRWYFGLETALKLNGMTHEYYTVDTVVTDSFRTTKVIGILDGRFQFLRRSADRMGFGCIRRGNLNYSDPEKTVLDIAYRAHRRGGGSPRDVISEYAEVLGRDKLRRYLARYPRRFQETLGGLE